MHYIPRAIRAFARVSGCFAACAAALYMAAAAGSFADEKSASGKLSSTTPGLTADGFAKVPGVIFARALADAPGKNLVVVALEFPPSSQKKPVPPGRCPGHRHPGSTYVYVTQGTLRLGLSGQPVQLVHAGGSFFEPPGALHTVAESASATDPASALAILIVPDRAPILIPNEECRNL